MMMNPVKQTEEKKKRVYQRKKKTETQVSSSSSADAANPPRILLSHQTESVELMEKAEKNIPLQDSYTKFDMFCSFGTLENPVGSGKTAIMLQVIKNDKLRFETVRTLSISSEGDNGRMLTGDPRNFYADTETGRILSVEFPLVLHTVPLNIVVCSKPLTTVWKKESDIMGVEAVVIDAPKHVESREIFKKLLDPLLVKENGVLILTNQLYGHALALLDHILNPLHGYSDGRHVHCTTPKRMIYDDVHSSIKWSRNYGNLCPLFTWCINSTPDIIPWNKIEYYLALSFLTMPDLRYNRRNNKGHVVHVEIPESSYVEAPLIQSRSYYRNHHMVKLLEEHLPKSVRDMLSVGDFDGAYRRMRELAFGNNDESNPAVQNDDEDGSMLVSERKPLQELVMVKYRKQMHSLVERRDRHLAYGFSIDSLVISIGEIQRKIDSLLSRLADSDLENSECPICMDEVVRGDMVTTKCCHNFFCKFCIGKVFCSNKICPLCRKGITAMDIYSLQNDGRVFDISQILNPVVKKSAALALDTINGGSNVGQNSLHALETFVSSKPRGSKFVVFSPTEGSAKAYKEYFKLTPYILEDLLGSAVTISKRLEKFEKGFIDILFLSSKSSNAGLNLQYATHLVIIDSNKELCLEDGEIKQCIGRIRRFPRKDPVPVHHITVKVDE